MEESDRTDEICFFVANDFSLNVGPRDITTPRVVLKTNGLCSTLGVVFWKNLSKPSPLFVQQGVSFSVFLFLFFLSTYHFFGFFCALFALSYLLLTVKRQRTKDVCTSTFAFCLHTF